MERVSEPVLWMQSSAPSVLSSQYGGGLWRKAGTRSFPSSVREGGGRASSLSLCWTLQQITRSSAVSRFSTFPDSPRPGQAPLVVHNRVPAVFSLRTCLFESTPFHSQCCGTMVFLNGFYPRDTHELSALTFSRREILFDSHPVIPRL